MKFELSNRQIIDAVVEGKHFNVAGSTFKPAENSRKYVDEQNHLVSPENLIKDLRHFRNANHPIEIITPKPVKVIELKREVNS
jgi:hypothetical protein